MIPYPVILEEAANPESAKDSVRYPAYFAQAELDRRFRP
jgi:hypothetical protein